MLDYFLKHRIRRPIRFIIRVLVGLLGYLTLIWCPMTTDGDVTEPTASESSTTGATYRRKHGESLSTWYDFGRFPAINVTNEEADYFDVVCGTGHYGVGPRPRQEYRSLSDEQRNRLHDAFNQMRNTLVLGGGGRTEYEVFVVYHRFYTAPGAHFGPSFVLWHREYILR